MIIMKIKKIINFILVFSVVSLITACNIEPTRQFVFFNSSNQKLNIVMVKDSVFILDKMVEPHSNVFGALPLGTYNVNTYNTNEDLVHSFKNYKVVKEKDRAKNSYICVDLMGETMYQLVLSSYRYESTNSLSQAIYDNSGLAENEILSTTYKSDQPFILNFGPLFPNEPLPNKIDVLSSGWALVPLTKTITSKNELYEYIDTYFDEVGIENK